MTLVLHPFPKVSVESMPPGAQWTILPSAYLPNITCSWIDPRYFTTLALEPLDFLIFRGESWIF